MIGGRAKTLSGIPDLYDQDLRARRRQESKGGDNYGKDYHDFCSGSFSDAGHHCSESPCHSGRMILVNWILVDLLFKKMNTHFFQKEKSYCFGNT